MLVSASAVVVAVLLSTPAQNPASAAPSPKAPPVEPKTPGVEPTPIPAPAPSVRRTVVVVDDRTVKDQAPGKFLERTIAELERRRDFRVVKVSDARKRLDGRSNKELSACGDDAGCLATAARDMGCDVVVTVRLTRREGAYFLALTRIASLNPQITDDAATLAGTDADAFAYIPDAVGELFPDAEVKSPE